MKCEDEYGAMIVLTSSWNDTEEICVQFPDEIKDNVKLRHAYKHNGDYHCLPNESSGYFGSVVAKAKTLKEAITKVNEYAEQIICLDLEYTPISMEKSEKLMANGRKVGIEMEME
jgi:hypothetical protein